MTIDDQLEKEEDETPPKENEENLTNNQSEDKSTEKNQQNKNKNKNQYQNPIQSQYQNHNHNQNQNKNQNQNQNQNKNKNQNQNQMISTLDNVPILKNVIKAILDLIFYKRVGRVSEIEKVLYESLVIKLHYVISTFIFLTAFLSISYSWYYDSSLTCVSHFNAEGVVQGYILNICSSYSYVVETKNGKNDDDDDKKFVLFYKWIPYTFFLVAALNFFILKTVKRRYLYIEDDNSIITFVDHFYLPLDVSDSPSLDIPLGNNKSNSSNNYNKNVHLDRIINANANDNDKLSTSVKILSCQFEEREKESSISKKVKKKEVKIDIEKNWKEEEKKEKDFGDQNYDEEEQDLIFKNFANNNDETRSLKCVKRFLINWNGYSYIFYNYLICLGICLCTDIAYFLFLDFCLQSKFRDYGYVAFPYNKFVRNFTDPMSRTFPPFVKCKIFAGHFSISNQREEELGCHFTYMELYEKIFLFIWIWLIFLTIITFIYSFIVWPVMWMIPMVRNKILAKKFKSKSLLLLSENKISIFEELLKFANVGDILVLNCAIEQFSKRNFPHFEKFCDLLISPNSISVLKNLKYPLDRALFFYNRIGHRVKIK